MQDPALVIMAAGMGSRFGGLKQITPVDAYSHALIDFSLYDARRVGFKKVVFLIKKAIEEEFRQMVGTRMERYFDVKYAYQELEDLPEGFAVPAGREKPWGTGHAIALCRGVLDEPFAVVNSDDFYGVGAFQAIYDFLREEHGQNEYVMVGYRLRNTVTDSGSVSRGICRVKDAYLESVTERKKIFKKGEDAEYTEDGETFHALAGNTVVSMNFFGFQPSFPSILWERFPDFLKTNLQSDPLKCEYLLPSVTNDLLKENRCSVRVLECGEIWHGMTYREDLDTVVSSIASLKKAGVYPERLWE